MPTLPDDPVVVVIAKRALSDMTPHVKMIVIGLVLLATVAVPIYVVGSMALAYVERQERFIVSVSSTIVFPTSYAGVAIKVDYYYKKDAKRLRVVASLPTGYPLTAFDDTADTPIVVAAGVLPEWACRLQPLADGNDGAYSLFAADTGMFLYHEVYQPPTVMQLTNRPSALGELAFYDGIDTILGDVPVLGNANCQVGDDVNCAPDTIGELVAYLHGAADVKAWATHYDAAPLY